MPAPPITSRRAAAGDSRTHPGTGPGSAGHVLDAIRRAGGLTRAEIIDATGLSRSTVGARLDLLGEAQLIGPATTSVSTRGRPPGQFHLRSDSGVLLVADAGATGVRVALTDLTGTVLHEARSALDVATGPKVWLSRVETLFDEALEAHGTGDARVEGIGIALPGPVDVASATVVSPPIMRGWDGYPIREWFKDRFACPLVVENDANAMTLGEYRAGHADRSSMLMVKVATGVGAGIIAGGTIYRGFDGAAGDIGHIQIPPPDGEPAPLCRCGNVGCVEAYAGGWALVRDLNTGGRSVSSTSEVVALVAAGDPLATTLSRRAGRIIGIALSDAVSLLNPGVVVIGGELAAAEVNLVAGIRESVYRRSLPLATRQLQIVSASLGDQAGVAGLTAVLADHIFDPARIDAALLTESDVQAGPPGRD